MDVINAAKKISEAGTKLDKLSRQIADQCPESRTKDDMLAYLDRIALYCHQLNITSKVKADVQNISGELIVSGVSECVCMSPALIFVALLACAAVEKQKKCINDTRQELRSHIRGLYVY